MTSQETAAEECFPEFSSNTNPNNVCVVVVVVVALLNFSSVMCPGACFSKAPETFRARKALFSSSVSKLLKTGKCMRQKLLV